MTTIADSDVGDVVVMTGVVLAIRENGNRLIAWQSPDGTTIKSWDIVKTAPCTKSSNMDQVLARVAYHNKVNAVNE